MAIIQPSGLIASIRGKVGGAVFQLGRYGNIVRTNTTPVNRNTLAQNKTRKNTFNLLQTWTSFTAAQRALWNAFVQYYPIPFKKNSKLFITGQQAFIKLNLYRLEYDLSILISPAFTKCEITPIDLTLSSAGGILTATADRILLKNQEFIILFLTTRFNASVNNPGSKFRIINFITTSTNSFNITQAYRDVFGFTPAAGDTLFMKYTNVSKISGILFPFKSDKVLL